MADGSSKTAYRVRRRVTLNGGTSSVSFGFFSVSESIVSVTMAGWTRKRGKFALWESAGRLRRISRRRINVAVKDRECRVLAPLKCRLAPPSRNLRRDYDVRLQNPVGNGNTSRRFREKFPLLSILIRANGDRIARPGRQLFGQRLLNSFHVANLIATASRYLFAYTTKEPNESEFNCFSVLR